MNTNAPIPEGFQAQAPDGLRDFNGPPERFWAALAEKAAADLSAPAAAVFARSGENAEWRCLSVAGGGGRNDAALRKTLSQPALAEACARAGGRWSETLPGDGAFTTLGVVAPLSGSAGLIALLALMPTESRTPTETLLDRLSLTASAAPLYHARLVLDRARADVERFSGILDLLAALEGHRKFMAAIMALCNELTSRLGADRAALGWLRRGYIRVRAISHMEKFEKKMAAVQSMEAAMEEAFEQDCETVWPSEDETVVARDLRRYTGEQTAGNAACVPLRRDGEPVAAILVERKAAPFTEAELRWLRLCADQVMPRLTVLEAADVWFGARAWRFVRRQAAKLAGAEHTGAKLAALAGLLLMAFVLFGRWPHRVKGAFDLRSEVAAILPAPFDGYLDLVMVEKGEMVIAGQTLATLDTRDLLMEEASALADFARHTREAEKARAERDLAAMRMSEAMAEQASARLELVRYRLARSDIRAPFDGAVVEGDHRERTGAPVRAGEILFKVAQLADLKIEAMLDERDIDFVNAGAGVKLVFAGRPTQPHAARVERIDPMAQTHDGANVFRIHCAVEDSNAPWWRPGMSGTARIDAGYRTPLWLLSRRTLDYLRLRWGW